MAIEKNKVLRLESELSSRSRGSMSSDEDEFPKVVESGDEDDESDDCDSGAGSDDFDLLELGETGDEFVQVGDQTCSIPTELYDLPGFGDILSMDVWNDCLTEDERFGLTKYLPDMDQEMFVRTLKELFTGRNMHFGSPINKLFEMFKGGLCEPRVALYRQGLNFFQNRKHYHLLRKHQNSVVTNLYQIRDAWANCKGYSIEEKLRVLNIIKSQKSLMHEKMEELESDPSEREDSGDGLWTKRLKEQKVSQKAGHYNGRGPSPTFDFSSRGRLMGLETPNYGMQNPKGTLKVAGLKMHTAKELGLHHGIELKSGPYGPAAAHPRQIKASEYNSGSAFRMREQVSGDDEEEEEMYEVAVQRDQSFPRTGSRDKAGSFKVSKQFESSRGGEYSDSLMGLPVSLKNEYPVYGRNRTVNQLSDIDILTARPSNSRLSYDYLQKHKYPDSLQEVNIEDQVKYRKIRMSTKGNQVDLLDGGNMFWHDKAQGEPFPIDPPSNYGEWNVKRKMTKLGRSSPDLNVKDRLLNLEYRAKPSQLKQTDVQNERRNLKANRMFAKGEETDLDSSEQSEDDDDNPLMRSKWAYPSGISGKKSVSVPKKAKFVKKDKKGGELLDGSAQSSRKMGDLGDRLHISEGDNYTVKAKQKGRGNDISVSKSSMTKALADSYFPGPGRVNGNEDENNWVEHYKFGRNDQLQGQLSDRLPGSAVKPAGKRQKAETFRNYSVLQSSYLQDNTFDNEDDLLVSKLARDGTLGRTRKSQDIVAYEDDDHERSDLQLVGGKSTKKRKLKNDLAAYMDDLDDNDHLDKQQFDDIAPSKKRGKRKIEDDAGSLEKGASEPHFTEVAAEDDLESKPLKKPYTLITPTVHTGFSFSIIHLLSAVRMAMITVLPDDTLNMRKHYDRNDGALDLGEDLNRQQESNSGVDQGNVDINTSEKSGQGNIPSLTVQEIVNRVRSNPGDPSILETQEPLQDLIRGVLKIFSSKSAPLGAKGWKTIVVYEKSTKTWSWVGPVPRSLSDQDIIEEVTSPEAWGLPHKMLVKLVDSFANWLKSGQETLRQIGSLPAPPLTLMQLNLDEKERFRDLRAQKSLNTISPSSDEVRSYFRREEVLRYSIPDRAFSYTAVDGRKSIVAPLRRCGGKPTSKARDHFMLKRDRPPHVTILCLVRDAAARLPGSIGTRADVCTLIRDSQYIVEEVSDAQVNQVVSGALDRLHYERDPCVQFDGERKLWVYLHREREEEDFEDDGTSSTKKWKRQKKEALEPSELGIVTVAYNGNGEGDQAGFDLSSDPNVDPSGIDEDKRVDPMFDDDRHVEDNVEGLESGQGIMYPGPPMVWETHDLNPVQENRLLCQENNTNEDFHDENFSREQQADLLRTSLL